MVRRLSFSFAVIAIISTLFINTGCSTKPTEVIPSDSINPFINQMDSTTTAISTGIAGIEFNGGNITAYVNVKSTENIGINSLWAGNFTIREIWDDGQGGEDTAVLVYEDITFTCESVSSDSNISVALLRSMSTTVAEDEENLLAWMERIINAKEPADSMAIIGFHSYDTLLMEFTRNIALLKEGIDFPSYWGRSATFRAINRAVTLLGDQSGKKGIIVFGDGLNNEEPTDRNTIISSLNNANIPLYFVIFGENPDTQNVEQISIQSDGYYIYYKTSGAVWSILDHIRGVEDNTYNVMWERRTPAGRRGKLEISVVYQSAIGISSSTGLYYFEAP